MFRRIQTDGHMTFIWVLHKIGGKFLFNKIYQFVDFNDNEQSRSEITADTISELNASSNQVEACYGGVRRLRFEPGNWLKHNVNG